MSKFGQENRGYTPRNDGFFRLAGASFKPSARTGTHLRPIPGFDRRQLLTANDALQLWQQTARLAARRACRAATFAAVNCLGMSAPVPKYISSGIWP